MCYRLGLGNAHTQAWSFVYFWNNVVRMHPIWVWGCKRAEHRGPAVWRQPKESAHSESPPTREAQLPRSSPTLRAGCCSAWTPHAAGCHLQSVLQGKSTLNIRVTIHCDVQSCREPEKLLVELTALGSARNSSLWCSELHGTWEAAGGGNSPGLFITQAHLSVLACTVVIQPARPVLAKRFLIFSLLFLSLPLLFQVHRLNMLWATLLYNTSNMFSFRLNS